MINSSYSWAQRKSHQGGVFYWNQFWDIDCLQWIGIESWISEQPRAVPTAKEVQ